MVALRVPFRLAEEKALLRPLTRNVGSSSSSRMEKEPGLDQAEVDAAGDEFLRCCCCCFKGVSARGEDCKGRCKSLEEFWTAKAERQKESKGAQSVTASLFRHRQAEVCVHKKSSSQDSDAATVQHCEM